MTARPPHFECVSVRLPGSNSGGTGTLRSTSNLRWRHRAVVVNGNSVKFVAVELMMAKFDLVLAADGTMKGTMSNRQTTRRIEFKRVGQAKVELIPASPAVSKQLERDWEGSLETPGRAFG